jgi:hypothetical protein
LSASVHFFPLAARVAIRRSSRDLGLDVVRVRVVGLAPPAEPEQDAEATASPLSRDARSSFFIASSAADVANATRHAATAALVQCIGILSPHHWVPVVLRCAPEDSRKPVPCARRGVAGSRGRCTKK